MLVCFDKLLKLRPKCLVDRLAVENILKFMASYWEGLFYHYDKAVIPRTNNDLERFIRCLKVTFRKITGRASCHGFVVRYGAFVALLDGSLSYDEVFGRFRVVGYGVFRECFGEVWSFRCWVSFWCWLVGGFMGCVDALEAQCVRVVV